MKPWSMDDHQSQSGISSKAVGESKDWINELPDCILSYILSLLTIKDAAETSIVCRRWRNLWTARPSDLVLDIANIFGSVYAPVVARHERYYTFASMTPQFERQCYIQRVNKVLELLSCNKLDSFKVAFFLDREDTQALDKWI
uniref:putative F-box/LRR-repeat protein At3g59160 isoform X2 n=1 Tax=Fragaria vesca subsp. vesca TaxID=101020 RepID=UPI0005CB1737|nr:PREDICTED: putative F-box/LRR-repeat protein At3g59160 isoform X2 [Fragaria vesca subsp. vesca]